MSWGYFVDLRITCPSAAWKALMKETPGVLEDGFFGLEDRGLDAAFTQRVGSDDPFEKLLAWSCYRDEAVNEIEDDGETATARVSALLDKSLLDLASPLAALFDRVRALGGGGTLALLNDGTSSGEDGVELRIEDGRIARVRLFDCWDRLEALGAEIFGTPDAPKQGKPLAVNPFTGQPIAPAPKKKSAKKKSAPRKKKT